MKRLIFSIIGLLILSINIYSEELAKPFDFRNYQFLAAPALSESKSDSDASYSESNYGSGGFIKSLKELRITAITTVLCSILIVIVSRIGAAYNKRYEVIIEEPDHH